MRLPKRLGQSERKEVRSGERGSTEGWEEPTEKQTLFLALALFKITKVTLHRRGT